MYGQKGRRAFGVKAREIFGRYITNNKILLIICTAMMTAGICAGSIYCVSLKNGAALGGIGDFGMLSSPYDTKAVFLSSLANSAQLAFFMWLCGCTRLGIPIAPMIIALKGFACGFCIAAITAVYGSAGVLAAGVAILPQMLVMFVLMEIFCVAAINQALYSHAAGGGAEKRRRFVSYCVFCAMLLGGFVLCSLFESYVSPYLLVKTLGL